MPIEKSRGGQPPPSTYAHISRARHVAIIADGNQRWAATHGLPVAQGHEAAADTLKARIHDALQLGIQELTVYSFSTENWTRPTEEIHALLSMLTRRLARETPELHQQGVRMRFIGRRERLPPELLNQLHQSEQTTANDPHLDLYIALNYGGRAEILDAAKHFHAHTEQEFRSLLYAPDMHDPDLIIRTGNEQRLSNFLLWQSANSQLVFRPELWPDFTRQSFIEALSQFRQQQACV
jgi:undecaprenyl diphosphate synthase